MAKIKINDVNKQALNLNNNNKHRHYATNSPYYKEISPTNRRKKDNQQLNWDLSKELRRNNIWDPEDINYHQFRYRFGIADPKGQIGSAREYLFFTKPDIPIFSQNDWSLKVESTQMQPVLERSQYWRELRYNNFPVLTELQYNIDPKNPFNNLLGNTVSSNLDIPSLSGEVIETSNNQYGTNIQYRGSSEASNDNFDFSLEFKDTKALSVYHFFRAYEEFQTLKHTGGGKNLKDDMNSLRICYKYIIQKILYDQYSIYKFLVDEDGETILYYAKLYGVFSKNLPRDAFSNTQFDGGITLNIEFHAAFYDDMNPRILQEFNNVASKNPKIRTAMGMQSNSSSIYPSVVSPYNPIEGAMDYRRGIGAFVQTISDSEDPIHDSYYGAGRGNIYKLKWVTVDSIK